jgi:esterase/lipase
MVGVSLGGLMLPKIVGDYPGAKLVFVATGTRFMPRMKLAERAVKIVCHKHGENVAAWISQMPEQLLGKIYDVVHKPKNDEEREFCKIDKQAIINSLKGIDPKIHGQLARFLVKTDNRELIKKLKQKALVLSGRNDTLMPKEVGEELARGINGEFRLVEAEHFNVLNESALTEIRKFLA